MEVNRGLSFRSSLSTTTDSPEGLTNLFVFQAMLKRLENAKATTTLRKDKLLNEYNNQKLAGVSMGAVHPLERRKKRTGFRSPSPYGLTASDTASIRSTSTLRSTSTRMSTDYEDGGGGRRPQSAKSTGDARPLSAKKTQQRPRSAKLAPASRPDWESGW